MKGTLVKIERKWALLSHKDVKMLESKIVSLTLPNGCELICHISDDGLMAEVVGVILKEGANCELLE